MHRKSALRPSGPRAQCSMREAQGRHPPHDELKKWITVGLPLVKWAEEGVREEDSSTEGKDAKRW